MSATPQPYQNPFVDVPRQTFVDDARAQAIADPFESAGTGGSGESDNYLSPEPLLVRDDTDAKVEMECAADPNFTSAVEELKQQAADIAPQSFALVDFTEQPSQPRCAGWDEDTQRYVASIAKLAALFAAFELRRETWQLVQGQGVSDAGKLGTLLRDTWAHAPSIEVRSLSAKGTTQPALRSIFDQEFLTKDGEIAFHSTGESIEELGSIYMIHDRSKKWKQLARLGFLELMHLMIRYSDNEAASACISLLGLPYIKTLIRHCGLFTSEGRGLWLGGGYAAIPPSAMGKAKHGEISFQLLNAAELVAAAGAEKGKTSQGATARALATFMTLLVRRELVDEQASREMLGMMDFTQILDPPNYYLVANRRWPNPEQVYSKIGIDETRGRQVLAECAYIKEIGKRRRQGETLKVPPDREYVAVALDAAPGKKFDDRYQALREFGDQVCVLVDTYNFDQEEMHRASGHKPKP